MRKPTPAQTPPEAKPIKAPIDLIDVPPDRQREFQPAVAEAIAATLPTLGLIQPIGIAATGNRYRLIYGRHRLEAAKVTGWETIPARLIHLDEADLDASAGIHEATENLLRADLKALDRMAHLAAMKAAHDKLYPNASKAGRPKKMTREAEKNWPVFGQFAFSKSASEVVGISRSLLKALLNAWDNLSPTSRTRLRGSRLADRQSELFALARFEPTAQSSMLDLLLSTPPAAATVEEAWAKVTNKEFPTANARRADRYVRTLTDMPVEERDVILAGIEDEIIEFGHRRGWFS